MTALALCALLAGCDAPRKSLHHLVVVDPGHFHAALLQREMIPGVDGNVKVFAPQGPELEQYAKTIESYNLRESSPTSWTLDICSSAGYIDSIPPAGHGDILVTAGNNARKTDYICTAVAQGYNVLADKPMVIDASGFATLQKAYSQAEDKHLIIRDIMTERHDDINQLVRAAMSERQLFGAPRSVEIVDVHHFYKEVSGAPLRRPAWYYDVRQQGEGIVDVTTHFIDLALWWCFPGSPIGVEDIADICGEHAPTDVTAEQFERSTGLAGWPPYLLGSLRDSVLAVMCNGKLGFTVREVPVSVEVRWDFEGSPDTFSARIKGEKAALEIIQDASTSYERLLRVSCDPSAAPAFVSLLNGCNGNAKVSDDGVGNLTVRIPPEYRSTHEEHFAKVLSSFLEDIEGGEKNEWETVNTLTKYYITTRAQAIAAGVR